MHFTKHYSRTIAAAALGSLIFSLVFTAFAFIAPLAPSRAAPPAPGRRVNPNATAEISLDVDLPSASTGAANGTLALRIFAPAATADARYPQGAPVLIFVPGADSAGSLKPVLGEANDVIRIIFLFPGGTDPRSGRSSDGVYDHRGPDSIAALRDVIRFAAGELPDDSGKTIDELLPVPVLHDNIGLLGASNGGNIVAAVASRHGADLSDHLRYIIQWESPVSSQIATVDLGGVNLDCPSGERKRLNVVNPRYLGYGPLMVNVDYSQIAYDPADARHPIFLDGTGDGHYTTTLDPRSGCQTPDLDLDGVLETNEDFPLAAYTDGARRYYSRPATQALADYGLFGGTWPADIATVSQAAAYWDLREAVRHYATALGHIPNLEGMVLASLEDHVQAPSDHPHIRQAFEGWDAAGAWVQINPDPAYLVEADPALSGRTDLPANSPNTPPSDWNDEVSYTVPEDIATEVLQTAAVWQMADRAYDASGATPTFTPTPTSASTSTPTLTPSPTRTPTPTPTHTPTPACVSSAPSLWQTTSINNDLHGWPASVGNHVKIFDLAVDETRNRVYVQGAMTPGIAIIDGRSDALIGQVESGLDDAFHRTYLAVDEASGDLFVADYFSQTLRRIDPDTGAITGPVTLSAAPEHILFDPTSNRVYLSLKQEHKVAVYDAATLTLLAEMTVPFSSPMGMTLDSSAQRLYVVDARPPKASNQSLILVFDTASLTAKTPLTFSNATGHPANFVTRDPATGRFFVTTPEEMFRLAPNAAVEWMTPLPGNAKAPIYWEQEDAVYVVSRDGVSRVRSTLTAVDAATGAIKKTLDLQSGGAQRLVLDKATGKLYTPAMNYTDVVVIDAKSLSVEKKIDLGNTVEDIAYAPADGTAYFANRLGGSVVMAYNPETGAWSEFETGGWPTAVDVDPALNRLFVLSHHEGTVSAYDLSDPLHPSLLGVVPLGLNDLSDAITNQTLDATRHRLITTHPEHDSVVIVDGQTLTVTATIEDVPSFTYDAFNTKSRGHLQPAVEESLNKLYVFVPDTRRVDVFDGDDDYAYLRSIDLSGRPWRPAFNDFVVWADSARHRLYVGELIIDATTDTVIGQLPAGRGQMVVGIDEAANRLYTVGLESAGAFTREEKASRMANPARSKKRGMKSAASSRLYLYALDRDDYSLLSRTELRSFSVAPPYFALDAARERLFAGYMTLAKVDVYALGCEPPQTPTSTPTPTRTPTPSSTPAPAPPLYLPLILPGSPT